MECLVDFVNVEGTWADLCHLLDLIENDPVPFIRHKLIRMLVDKPPLERVKRFVDEKQEALVLRLWSLIKLVLLQFLCPLTWTLFDN